MRDLTTTLEAAGFDVSRLPGSLAPKKFYRFPAPGQGKRDDAGWLIVHGRGIAAYGDWITGEKHIWRAANENTLRVSESPGQRFR